MKKPKPSLFQTLTKNLGAKAEAKAETKEEKTEPKDEVKEEVKKVKSSVKEEEGAKAVSLEAKSKHGFLLVLTSAFLCLFSSFLNCFK